MQRPGAHRRHALVAAALAVAWTGFPGLAAARRAAAPQMTDGPFYPPARWRSATADWDADLTRVQRGTQLLVARGEHLALDTQIVDGDGRAIDGAEVEIWQCDTLAAYRHPSVRADPPNIDPGFQGFGAARSDAQGRTRFRTIKPVAYPGRTPHIHVKVRHATFGEWTSQLFVSGDPGNARDFLWRQLDADGQAALAMRLQPASGDGLRWQVQHAVVVPD